MYISSCRACTKSKFYSYFLFSKFLFSTAHFMNFLLFKIIIQKKYTRSKKKESRVKKRLKRKTSCARKKEGRRKFFRFFFSSCKSLLRFTLFCYYFFCFVLFIYVCMFFGFVNSISVLKHSREIHFCFFFPQPLSKRRGILISWQFTG